MDGKASKTDNSSQLISLGKAAKAAPGRPSTNAMWRWCRRGVISRSGQRIKLEHVRIGGRIFTSADWVKDFGHRLAEADAVHFDERSNEFAAANKGRCSQLAQINEELEEAGL